MNVGDRHRFGKQVCRILDNEGKPHFLKPRSIFIEYLMLDRRSEFNLLRKFMGYELPVEATQLESWLGKVTEISGNRITCEERDQSESYATNAGKLVAIATFLGLTDLHAENIVLAKIDNDIVPVPVDLEIALWNCVAGMDTLLYQSRLISASKAGLASYLKVPYRPSRPDLLLDAFLETSSNLIELLPNLLLSLDRRLVGHPCRVLFRNTRTYLELLSMSSLEERDAHLARLGEPPLVSEELLQLEHGDVPYFFFYRERKAEILFFSDEDTVTKCDTSTFSRVVQSANTSVSNLTSGQRLASLEKLSALQIYTAFKATWSQHLHVGTHFKVSKIDEQSTMTTSRFQARFR